MNSSRLTLPLLLVSLAVATATVLASVYIRVLRAPVFEATVLAARPPGAGAEQTNDTSARAEDYVNRRALWPRMRDALGILGDRLEKPGKERLVMTGMLVREGDPRAVEVHLIREYPDRLRLKAGGQGQRPVVFRGNVEEGTAYTREEAALVETLVFDTAEHFFASSLRGAAVRHLGSSFHTGGVEASADPASYDLYEIDEEQKIDSKSRRQTKFYALNSNTQLLERVNYETQHEGERVKVEVRLGDWRRIAGQMVPHRIERWENDRQVWALSTISVAVAPRQNDDAFNATLMN